MLLLLLAIPSAVFADQVVNNIDTTIDPALETVTITAGGSATVGFYIRAITGGGDATGCNATGSNPATVNLSVPAGVSGPSTGLIFTDCGIAQNVMFSSSTPGSYNITVASVTGGKDGSKWDTAPAAFTLIVNPAPPSDTTPPVITANVSGTMGNGGWYTSDVSVSWSVVDNESTVSSKTGCDPVTINADTAGQTLICSATSAGGSSSESVMIKRDATPPAISGAALPAPNPAGWNNTDVTVSFTCNDNLSGVASCGPDQTLTGEGAGQQASGAAVDNAGNSASATVGGINIDKTPPAISGSASPTPNGAGWNNTDVTVSFTCSDGLSGVASCGPNQTLTGEGAGQTASGAVVDIAGNSASATVGGINIDKTPPTISGSASPGPNAAGWNNTNVTISFSCDDSLSGVASCTPNQTLNSEGAGQTASGAVVDNAGNSASATVGGINIDKTAPMVSMGGFTPGAAYTLGSVPAASCYTEDGMSGVATYAALALTGGNHNGVGSFTATCSGAMDIAGNAGSSASATYNVKYYFSNFYRPVDNLPTFNMVKAGSAVPIKFSLNGDKGLNIFAAGYPKSVAIACDSTAPVDGVEEIVTAGSSSLSYDATADQYVYVWKTEKTWTGCRQLVVMLNDGQSYRANFKFTK